jgi:hypothetical protein
MHKSPSGTSRHFAAAQQFGRFRSEADIEPRSPSRIYEYTALVPEAQSRRASEVVALERAVRQSAIEFHEADVNIPLRCKLPVDNAGDRVQRTGALRVLAPGAGHDPVLSA